MKKYIVFFLSIILLLGTVLVYNTINVKKEKELNFSESGYILNSLSDRYYFYKDETYTKSYDDKIVFNDTEGEKVTIGQENFLHYSSGSIEALKESVLLDLNNIDQNPILYYNISANKEIKKVSNRYTIKNLKSDIQFDKAIWKISDNKYIVVANSININLSSGVSKEVVDYVEIEYSDNEIVNLYNQETNYQTISSDSLIELPEGIKINLGSKIVTKDSEIKMSLDNMVINSDDNVNIVDLSNYEVKKDEEEKDEENETKNNQGENTEAGNSGVINMQGGNGQTTTTTTNNSTIISNNGNEDASRSEGANDSVKNEGKGEGEEEAEAFEPSEIVYPTNTNETTIDETKPIAEPVFKVDKMTIDATRFETEISIRDEDDVLSKDDDIIYQIKDDSTGKIIRETADVSNMKFSVSKENLTPNTQYSLIVSGKYIVDDTAYGKNFIYKTFVTSDIGIELIKDGFTDTSMSFEAIFDDGTLAQSAKVGIFEYYADTSSIDNAKSAVNITKDNRTIIFNGLESNTEYKVKIFDVIYNNASTTWSKEFQYKTLKKRGSFEANSFTDKKNGNFNLYAENVIDKDGIIQNYEYRLYEYTNGQISNTIAYRAKKDTEQDIVTVCYGDPDSNEDAKIFTEREYVLKIIATMYDNEKYIEVEAEGEAILSMPKKEYPTVSWELESIGATYINGIIKINDVDNAVNTNKNIKVEYKNSIGEKGTFSNIYEKDSDGNIPIAINMSNLKALETYTFDVYATVNIGETDQAGDSVDRENAPLGTIRVTTKKYDPIRAKYRNLKKGSDPEYNNQSFAINLKLNKAEEDTDEAIDNLDSLTLIVQESDSYSPNNNNKSERVINQKNLNEYTDKTTSLKEYVSDYGIDITPSLMGISNRAPNFTIGVTITKDGTSYSNLIPVEKDPINEDNLPLSEDKYKKNGIEYTAVWVTVDTTATSSEKEAPIVSEIYNINAGEHKKENLNNNTVVGYTVTANFEAESRKDRKGITYFVEDKDGNRKTTKFIEYTSESNSTIPACKFYFDDDEFSRGNTYKFGYEVEYENETQPCIEKTERLAQKQEPVFTMYPVSSYVDANTGNTLKYYYSYKDPDNSITKIKINEETHSVLYVDEDIFAIDQGVNQEIYFTELEENKSYIVSYKYSLSNEEEDTTNNLGNIKFESIVDIEDEDLSNYITCTVRNNNALSDSDQQILRINFKKKDDAEIDILSRVSMMDISFNIKENGSQDYNKKIAEYNYLTLEKNSDSSVYYIDFELTTQYPELWDLIDSEFQIKYSVYYDTGKIGFNGKVGENDEELEWVAYTDHDGYYLDLTDNSWHSHMSSIYEKQSLEFDNLNVISNVIGVEGKRKRMDLMYGGVSLLYQSKFIEQKHIKQSAMTKKTIRTEGKIVPGINVTMGDVGTESLKFEITTYNVEKYNDKYDPDVEIVIEVYSNNNELLVEEVSNDGKFKINSLGEGKYQIVGLKAKETYYMKIRYASGKYFYDVTNKKVGYKYYFNTGTGINISDVKVEYCGLKYTERYLKLSYKINKGEERFFDEVTYEFYDTSNGRKVSITMNNEKYEGDTESEEKTEIIHNIGIGPSNHQEGFLLEYGKEYRLDIIPRVKNVDLDKNANAITFPLSPLKDAKTGARFTRIDNEDNTKSIKINVTVNDIDCVLANNMYSNGYGIVEVRAFCDDGGEVAQPIYDVDGNVIEYLKLGSNNKIANKALYMKNVDFSKTYYFEYIVYINKTNSNITPASSEYIYTIDKISNNAGIDIGTADTDHTSLGDSTYKTTLKFHNAYHLTNINLINYTIYEYNDKNVTGDGNLWSSGFLKIKDGELNWINNTVNNYYGLELPFEFSKDKGYVIIADLYSTDYSVDYDSDSQRIRYSNYGDRIEIVNKYN